MRKCKAIIAGLISTVLFAGCAKMPESLDAASVKEQTAYIREDGSLQIAYSEDFNEPYYSIDGLKEFIKEECRDYNDEKGDEVVSLSSITLSDKKAKAVLTFKDDKAYEDFSLRAEGSDIKIYSPEESKECFDLSFYKYKGKKDETVKGSEVIDSTKMEIIEANGPLVLETYGKLRYYTAGSPTDSHRISIAENESAVVVINK